MDPVSNRPARGHRVEELVDDALGAQRTLPRYGTADPDRENTDFTDMSKPPTGHRPNEEGEAERAKYFGPDHMWEELNPTVGGNGLNKGQDRRKGERRKS